MIGGRKPIYATSLSRSSSVRIYDTYNSIHDLCGALGNSANEHRNVQSRNKIINFIDHTKILKRDTEKAISAWDYIMRDIRVNLIFN